MTFRFPRFGDRHILHAPPPGETVDLYADDSDAGDEEDVAVMSSDEPVETMYFTRLAGAVPRLVEEEIG